eukprot:scaffold17769_cov33-Tisochrysis_lutea.AAC.2
MSSAAMWEQSSRGSGRIDSDGEPGGGAEGDIGCCPSGVSTGSRRGGSPAELGTAGSVMLYSGCDGGCPRFGGGLNDAGRGSDGGGRGSSIGLGGTG